MESRGARWERLTGRERDVARLVAEGGTNREIAQDLENLPTVWAKAENLV